MGEIYPGNPNLPISPGGVSNGEFPPQAPSDVAVEAARRMRRFVDETVGRLGPRTSRRGFLAGTAALGAQLALLSACADEEAASRGETTGGRFNIPSDAMVDEEAARELLGTGDEPVFDMQLHSLEWPERYTGHTVVADVVADQQHVAQSAGNPRYWFPPERMIDEVFRGSHTTMGIFSSGPVLGTPADCYVDPMGANVMADTVAMADEQVGPGRLLVQGHVWVNVGNLSEALDAMRKERAERPIVGWKVYNHVGRPWTLDDSDPDGVPVGEAFLQAVEEIGPPIVAAHRGFGPVRLNGTLLSSPEFASPKDIGPAALKHPAISFVVYHSGYEFGDEGKEEYDPDASVQYGVDRLLRSVETAGIGPDGNVYAEVGSAHHDLMVKGDTTGMTHFYGKLLSGLGANRVVWGTDSVWYGSPQPDIMALRTFEISEEFQERYGYPALTPEVKSKIFWQNARDLHNVDPAAIHNRIDSAAREDDRVALKKQIGHPHYGFTDRRGFLAHFTSHNRHAFDRNLQAQAGRR